MPREDQDKLLELAAKLGISVNTSLQAQLGSEEAKAASFDDISVVLSKIDISPEAARNGSKLARKMKNNTSWPIHFPTASRYVVSNRILEKIKRRYWRSCCRYWRNF